MKKIDVKGSIIANNQKEMYDWFEMDATCPNDIISQLSDEFEDVEVVINSGGGSVFAGAEIYTALKEHKGKVTTKIYSLAASSASIVAMAGDTVIMSPLAQFMIHNVSVANGGGDYRDFQHTADILKNANDTIANAYTLKTGMTHDEILALMDNETWLSPQKAKELGFIDEVMFNQNNELQLVASTYQTAILPQKAVDLFNKKKLDSLQKNEEDFLMQENLSTKLKLIKLKGARP